MKPGSKKAATRRVRESNVSRVANHHGHSVVRHAGQEYVLVPLEDVERLQDGQDLRATKRALSRIKRALSKPPIPYEQARRRLGLA